jgi:heme A synthase
MALLGVHVVVVIRAGGFGAFALEGDRVALPRGHPRAARAAIAAAAIAFMVVILGGFTANVPGAAPACQGFPLCNGSVVAEGSAQTIHWTHRVLAFLLTFHVFGMAMAARRRESAVMRRASAALLGVILVQIVVAAVLVSTHLPPVMQSLHQAVGTLVWMTAVVTAGLAVRGGRRAQGAQGANALSAVSTSSTLSTPSTPSTSST